MCLGTERIWQRNRWIAFMYEQLYACLHASLWFWVYPIHRRVTCFTSFFVWVAIYKEQAWLQNMCWIDDWQFSFSLKQQHAPTLQNEHEPKWQTSELTRVLSRHCVRVLVGLKKKNTDFHNITKKLKCCKISSCMHKINWKKC